MMLAADSRQNVVKRMLMSSQYGKQNASVRFIIYFRHTIRLSSTLLRGYTSFRLIMECGEDNINLRLTTECDED